jgi:hypothetical protein
MRRRRRVDADAARRGSIGLDADCGSQPRLPANPPRDPPTGLRARATFFPPRPCRVPSPVRARKGATAARAGGGARAHGNALARHARAGGRHAAAVRWLPRTAGARAQPCRCLRNGADAKGSRAAPRRARRPPPAASVNARRARAHAADASPARSGGKHKNRPGACCRALAAAPAACASPAVRGARAAPCCARRARARRAAGAHAARSLFPIALPLSPFAKPRPLSGSRAPRRPRQPRPRRAARRAALTRRNPRVRWWLRHNAAARLCRRASSLRPGGRSSCPGA